MSTSTPTPRYQARTMIVVVGYGLITGFDGGVLGAFISGIACLGLVTDYFQARQLQQQNRALTATNLGLMAALGAAEKDLAQAHDRQVSRRRDDSTLTNPRGD